MRNSEKAAFLGENLRIAYVTPKRFTDFGGVEHVVRNFAEHLSNMGHRVTVIGGAPGSDEVEVRSVNGIRTVEIPTYAPGNAYHIPKRWDALRRVLREPFDIVHVHSAHSVMNLLPLRMREGDETGWKLLSTLHVSTLGYTAPRRVVWSLFWKHLLGGCLENSDAIHATSPLESEFVSEQFPSLKEKITTVLLGVEEDVLRTKWEGEENDYVLYSGRIEEYKRVDLVVKAVARLVKEGHDIELLVMGEGSQRDELLELAEREFGEDSDHFSYSPPRPRDEYLDVLSRARAAISMSTAENFNLFLAEAHAIGVPIIATPESAAFYPELGNVSSHEADEIAEEIERVFSDRGSSNKEHKMRTWKQVAVEMENTYRCLLGLN